MYPWHLVASSPSTFVFQNTLSRENLRCRTWWYIHEFLYVVFGVSELNAVYQRVELMLYISVVEEISAFEREEDGMTDEQVWKHGTKRARDIIKVHIHRSLPQHNEWSTAALDDELFSSTFSGPPRDTHDKLGSSATYLFDQMFLDFSEQSPL